MSFAPGSIVDGLAGVRSEYVETRIVASKHIGESRFFSKLARYYALTPSAVLIRTAEAELFSEANLESPILDLCCGDGFFSSLICPGSMEAGCDLSVKSLQEAVVRKQYRALACADTTRGIPFRNSFFRTVVSNSSLEHVNDIDSALREIARVLQPGGKLYFTLASHYAYDWWPLSKRAKQDYLRFQPVFNYFTIEEWQKRLDKAGLNVVRYRYYLDRKTTQLLLWLDYYFSRAYIKREGTLTWIIILSLYLIPKLVLRWFWQSWFGHRCIAVEGAGGGLFMVCQRKTCQ